ncbi:hypothetical protein ACT6NV_12585 [Robiginitalea sp. IMCC44478]|uniref:hypothetical protein n=1 Tax=Robiginitalea sp. IMCC44478 TaxID=3459122 RepID=UPI004040FAEF
MKKVTLLASLILLFSISCSPDEELFETVQDYANENPSQSDNPMDSSEDSNAETPDNPDPPADLPEGSFTLEVNSTPCTFGLDVLQVDGTLEIDCQIDLEGATVVLPMNVRLLYSGGEIINGTLRFNGGTIDGRLLNHTLDVEGTAELVETTFQFYPERWDITQGPTSDENSLVNRDNLNKVFKQVQGLGGSIFQIGTLDAYFNVNTPWASTRIMAEESISIPSNFTLMMSNETNLRVQPSGFPAYTLLTVFEGSNITIKGGNLYGDRWEHDYSPFTDPNGNTRNSHEWGHLLTIAGGKNILIEDITLSDATGDGFGVFGSAIRNAEGIHGSPENLSSDVTLRGAVINQARRNGMSILDGDGIIIENSVIKNTALGKNPEGVEYSSAGTFPKYGVSFEAYRVRESSGELKEYNRIENVILRNNNFSNNRQGDVVLYTCSNIIIENNKFDSRIGNIAAHSIIIRNNTFEARMQEDGTPFNYAISLQSLVNPWDGELNYDYEISGNTIKGYGNALLVAGKDYFVSSNVFINNKNNIGIGSLDGATFNNNEISSDVEYAVGYFTRGANLSNVSVREEKINVSYRAINLRKISAELSDPLIFEDCEFINVSKKDNFIESSNNISITNNIINAGFIVNYSQNIEISNNVPPN